MGAIITGLRLDHAVKHIKRMKTFLTRTFPIEFDIRQTEFIMNDVTVQAFPSKNSANTLRSYEDFCFCIIDEADFFKLSDQVEVKHAAEGYFLKSQPLMIWISTPNKRSGGMRSEEHTSELQSPCNLVCRLLLEKKKRTTTSITSADASPAQ